MIEIERDAKDWSQRSPAKKPAFWNKREISDVYACDMEDYAYIMENIGSGVRIRPQKWTRLKIESGRYGWSQSAVCARF